MSEQYFLRARAEEKMTGFTQQATKLAPQRPWLQAISELRAAASEPDGESYSAMGAILQPYLNWPSESVGGSSEIFFRLILYNLAKEVVDGISVPEFVLPSSMRELLVSESLKILCNSANEGADHFRVDNDLFLKDIALVAGRLLPAGAELVQPYSGIPRSILWQAGIRQLLAGIQYFLVQRRGFVGYLAFHLDDRQLDGFNPAGWQRTYFRLAELLELNPGISGVYGTAWFYDPAVSGISPHLAYLRTTREAGGARNFRSASAPGVVKSAIVKSRQRAYLYHQGKYCPRAYYLVWHRRELLAWARAQSEIENC